MRYLRRLGHTLAAGALLGAAIAPLQLILWPELEISVLRALLALLAWASWGAFWGGIVGFPLVAAITLFWPGIAAQPGLSRRLWRFLAIIAGVLLLGVALYNHQHGRELLARAQRHALVAAAVVVFIFVAWMIVLPSLRRLARRPAAWTVLPAGVVLVVLWWLWGINPAPAPAAETSPSTFSPSTTRLLLVSWEGADLPWLLPAMESGDMPFLRSRRDRGAWGQLRTLRPYARTAFFATLVTGCAPSVHGVVGRRAYRMRWLAEDPVGLLLEGPWPTPHHLPWRLWERAAAPAPRRAPLWTILERAGVRAGLAGWPGLPRSTWVIPPPIASEATPFSQIEADLRTPVEPALQSFPAFAPVTRSAFSVAVQVGTEALSRQMTEPADAVMVNLDLPARLRPLWTFEHPGEPQEEVLRLAARLLDEQLSQLWTTMGGEQVLLAVVSPYGLAPPTPWRRLSSSAAHRHRWRVSAAASPDGFMLLSGPGVQQGVRLRRARLADVTPTLLYLLDLPVARDMAGRVILDTVSEDRASSTPLRLIPSYPPGREARRQP